MKRWVTRGGLLFALAVGIVGIGAVASANNLLFLILAVMLSVLLISGLVNRLGLAGLELDFQLPEHVCARTPVTATLALRNVKGWMPSFSIRVLGRTDRGGGFWDSSVYFPVVPGGATLAESIEITFPRRGNYRQDTFAIATRFPFGFREKTETVDLVREALVYPSIEPQPGFEALLSALSGELEAQVRGRGSDFYGLRPYGGLESARFVDWKATARTGALQVREFAREPDRAIEIFLDTNVPEGLGEWFEAAVDCAAFLVWRFARLGASVRFRTPRFERSLPDDGDVWDVLSFLALVEPGGAPAQPPYEASAVHVVLSASPDALLALGWNPARVVSPEMLQSR